LQTVAFATLLLDRGAIGGTRTLRRLGLSQDDLPFSTIANLKAVPSIAGGLKRGA
jgi:hypothetical protein